MLSDDFLPAATGVGVHVQRLSQDLAMRGHEVVVVTSRRAGEPVREVKDGVVVYRVFTLKMFGFYQALPGPTTLARIFREHRVQLVHLHYLGFMLLLAMWVARRLQLPVVHTYHMTVDHLTQPLLMRPLRPLLASVIRWVCRRFAHIIVPSQALATQLQRVTSVPLTAISNPVVFEQVEHVEPVTKPLPFMVLFAGRLNPEKNLPMLLRAFALAHRRRPGLGLWIAGHGDQRARLEAMAADLGVGEAVRFLGFLPHAELARYFAACDLFVLPSLVETQGLVAMEAMRFKRPVIVTSAIVSAQELVEAGRTGFIVDPVDPNDLARRLCELAADPSVCRQMGAAGYERSLAFSPEQVVLATESCLRGVLRSSGRVAFNVVTFPGRRAA